MNLYYPYPYYEIPDLYQATSSIEPEIICLCEDHEKEADQIINGDFITKNYRDGDAVVVESTEKHLTWHEQVKYVTKKIQLYGWDTEEAREPIYKLSYIIHDLMNKINQLKVKINTLIEKEEFLSNVKNILNSIPNAYQFTAVKILMTTEQSLAFEYKEAIPFYLSRMVKTYGQREWNKLTRCDPLRQQALVNSVEDLKKKYKRLFVIAGEAHFIGEEYVGEQLTENIAIVKDYFKDKRFVVLKPKSHLVTIEADSNQFQAEEEITEEDEIVDLSQLTKTNNWHPDSWMKRSKQIQLNSAYEQLYLEFFRKHKFAIVEKE